GAGTWSGGTFAGKLQVAAGQTLTVNSATTKSFGAGTLTNDGTVTWSDGVIDVVGSGTIANNAQFNITANGRWFGDAAVGSGTVTFANNATGTVSSNVTVGVALGSSGGGTPNYFNFTNDGRIDVQQGTLYINQQVSGPAGGSFTNAASGRVDVAAGAVLEVQNTMAANSGIIELATGGTFRKTGGFTNAATGILRGTGLFDVGAGNALTNLGTISPGPGTSGTAGTLAITGDLANSGTGQINLEIGGTGAGSYDVLAVSGTATLGGTLNVATLGAYTPVPADSVNGITAAGFIGDFAVKNLPASFTGTATGTTYALAFTGAGACVGADVCWDGGGDHVSWTDPINWSGNILPGIGDLVLVNYLGGVTVTLSSGSYSIKGLTTAAGNHLTINGGALTLADAATTSNLTGNLNVSSGTLTATGALNASVMNLSGGTVNGSGKVTVSTDFNQTGGSFAPTGSIDLTRTLGNLSFGAFSTSGTIRLATTGANDVVITGDLTATNAGLLPTDAAIAIASGRDVRLNAVNV
ncbi:MAG TPA: hypothetical protein PKD29_04860, partial [Rhodocyclaceae bacterium]|nr:hypothetical protein [Rhodocyclaceae bacterium]